MPATNRGNGRPCEEVARRRVRRPETGSVKIAVGGRMRHRNADAPEEPQSRHRGDGDELMALFERVEDDDDIGMLAITGAGDIFCGGFEAGVNPNLVESLAVLSKPTVAIVNGDAIDEGMELAMAADIRVALADAHFALTQPSRGEMPRFGGTQRLPRLVGIGNAMRMFVAGAEIDGEEAMQHRAHDLSREKSQRARRAGR